MNSNPDLCIGSRAYFLSNQVGVIRVSIAALGVELHIARVLAVFLPVPVVELPVPLLIALLALLAPVPFPLGHLKGVVHLPSLVEESV